MQKSEKNKDLRVRRTRKMLLEALMELTVERGYANITVRDIAERAMVNRSTFYRHYLDKDDLLMQYMDEVFAQVAVPVEPPSAQPPEPDPDGVPIGLLRLIEHLQTYSEFYRVMLSEKGDSAFTERFRKNSEKRYRYLISLWGKEPGPNDPPVELRLSYVSRAGIGAFWWWLDNNQPCTPEQLARWVSKLGMASVGIIGAHRP